MSGIWRCSSSKTTLISRRARLAPRQKCAPPPPKPACGLGLRPTSKVNGSANLSSSRLAEQYHRVALSPACHRGAAQLAVLGQRAPHVDDRRRPPHDLLDRGRCERLVVGPPFRALVGIPGERQDTVADRVAGGLVARDHQQDEERRDLGRRQPLTVDLGLHQRGRQVLLRVDSAVLGVRGGVRADVHRDLDELLVVLGDVLVPEPEDHVGPVEDLLVVVLGDAHHVADHLQRQRAGQLRDHLTLAVGMCRRSSSRRGGVPGPGRTASVRATTLRGERPADDVAQPQMLADRP